MLQKVCCIDFETNRHPWGIENTGIFSVKIFKKLANIKFETPPENEKNSNLV